ncbi:uncharacterized protein LOC108650223, partial [Drosophila navojoa]|uniref:uncharacterized protein LOC108650223 n=1 Tax=Drosophila navojoa TaxID=7232 RepID=UPI0011BD858E
MNSSYSFNFDRSVEARSTSTPVSVSLSSLHRALIEYATVSSRLLFIQDPDVYTDFHHPNERFNEYSNVELCEIMLKSVLPNVHLYQLPTTIKDRLKLLELNPCFQKTHHGFQYSPNLLGVQFVLQPKTDFSLPEELPTIMSAQRAQTGGTTFQKDALMRAGSSSHTMLLGNDARGPKFELSMDIAAPLSAMLSNDWELSSNELHHTCKIKRRLQRAKYNFQETGNASPYRTNLLQLVDNMDMFDKLKKHL